MTQTYDSDTLRKEYEEMRARQAAERASREGGATVGTKYYWKPAKPVKVGTPSRNVVRIVPVPGKDKWYVEYQQGWINKMPIVPPSSVDPEAEDPFRDHLNKLRSVTGEEGKKAYLDAKDRTVYDVFVVDRAEPEKGPQKWTLKVREFMTIQSLMYDAGAGQVYDSENGRDLIVMYDRGNKNGAIAISAAFQSSPLGTPEQIEAWTAVNLWDAYRVGFASDPEFIRAVIAGTVTEYFEAKKNAREQSKNQEPAPEADPVAAPTHTTDTVADDAAAALAALAPKFWVKSPKNGSTNPTPMTLAQIREQFGDSVEIQDMDMSGWKSLKEFL